MKPPHFRDMGIGVIERVGGRVRVGVGIHGSEFQNLEQFFVFADPILFEEHGTLTVALHGDRDDQHRERQQEDQKKRTKEVEDPFEK